jgi:glucosamine kinase
LSTCGGWGPQLSDQGSGHAIGANALRAIFLAMDEDRSTILQQAVLDFWKLSSVELLIEYANRTPAPDVSRLAALVQLCAEQGDQVALEVMQREGEGLAYLVRLLIRRLRRLQGDEQFTPSLAFAGSIMERVDLVRNALVDAVKREFPRVEALPDVVDPIDGALWRARDAAAFAARAVESGNGIGAHDSVHPQTV